MACIPTPPNISNQRCTFPPTLPFSPHVPLTIKFPLQFVTGKQILFGYDSQNRPALYMFPSRQNTETSDRQIHQVVWVLERAVDLMGPGTELVFQQSCLSQGFLILFR